ncbi:hypothetical protein [Myxococcus faecalis]|uniref:hypothetical protein n=1 Tax=Myxococcus faecalis TaxID=3115646 RepID=UPI003CF9739B
MSTTSMSTPDMLAEAPVSRGRSSAWLAGVPSTERVLLKKLFTGLALSEMLLPLTRNWSPVRVASPSKASTPSLASKPELGTLKPDSVTVWGLPLLT